MNYVDRDSSCEENRMQNNRYIMLYYVFVIGVKGNQCKHYTNVRDEFS